MPSLGLILDLQYIYKKADTTSLTYTLAGTRLKEKYFQEFYIVWTPKGRAELTGGKEWTNPFPVSLVYLWESFPFRKC